MQAINHKNQSIRKSLFLGLILLSFFLILFLACEEEKGLTEEKYTQIKEIYKSLQWETGEELQTTIEQYNLDNEEAMADYYETIKAISLDRELWEQFLSEVSQEL